MFILRQVSEETESNYLLGKSYNLIEAVRHPEEFNRTLKIWGNGACIPEEAVYAFLIYNEGADLFALQKPQNNYIMTSDGKTFSNITFR
jgi:hypothetical protein